MVDSVTSASPLRARLFTLVESAVFQRVMIAAILLNAVVFGLETSARIMQAAGPLLEALDQALLALFVVEIALRLAAHGVRFFRDPWSVFDFVLTAIGLAPATESLTALRALRVLRLLRLISMVPQMRVVVSGLLAAIPGMFAISGLMLLLFYISAVIATKLFAGVAPQWFGDLATTMFTLFQIMTLEAWSEIAKGVMEHEPLAWLFFVPFILITSFTVLNLFIAVIVGAMESERMSEPPGPADLAVMQRLDSLSREIAALSAAMRKQQGRQG
jgi:voltage-gated sodium channel